MRIWRGLGKRIVLCSIASGLSGLAVTAAITRRTTRETMQSGFAPYIHRTFDEKELARCERSPETWALALGRGARLDAYDAATLRSRNSAAPALDVALFRRLASGEPAAAQIHRFGSEHGGTILLHGAASGPCSLIQATLPPHTDELRRDSYLLLAAGVLVMALAAGLGFMVVVSPLTRRIDRLRIAAGRVGSSSGYSPAREDATDELGELSQILDDAHGRIRNDARVLEERQNALEKYLADIAHDLTTPISSLQLSLEQAGLASRNAEAQALIQASMKEVVYLAGLTSNLRLACQLRDGWDPASGNVRVDLVEVAENVSSRVRYFAKNRNIALDVARPDGSVFARCHPTAAEQILTNLVENAVSYGNPGGHVAVLLESTGDRFVLVVADDGPGVLPTELPRLGERTFRSDEARQRDPSGSGLGLAISSEISRRCGWSLRFEREEPRGLRVVIEGTALV